MAFRSASILVMSAAACAGCVEAEPSSVTCGGPHVQGVVVILESDNTTSTVGRLDEGGCVTEVSGGLALSGDTSLSLSQGRVFVADRTNGLIHEIDPAGPSILRTFAASGPGEVPPARFSKPNPYDIAVDAEGRLWIARYDWPSVAVLGADGGWLTSIDLAQFADADGIPEAEAITIVGDTAYVALETIPHAVPVDDPPPGLVVPIDVATYAIGTPITLAGSNPFGRLTPAVGGADALVVSTPGAWNAISDHDGVDVVDLATGESASLVSESTLGGSAVEALVAAKDEGYAIAAGTDDYNRTRLVRFDPSSGGSTAVLAETGGFYLGGLVVDGSFVIVGDATPEQAGLRWFDRATNKQVGRIAVHQAPPRSMVAIPAE